MASFTNTLRSMLRFFRHDAYSWFKRFGKRVGWWKLSAVAGILIGILGTLIVRGGPAETPLTEQGPRTVSVRSVGELAGVASLLPVVGIVTSQSEADVRTQSSGEIVRLYKQLGDSIRAGEIIAEMDNARERAAVLQSEGVADGARAQLNKVTRGARDEQVAILESGVASAETSLAAARTAAVNTLLSSYATVDETLRRKTDPMFNNPDTSSPSLLVQSTDSQAANDAASARVSLGATLKREANLSSTLSASNDLEAELARTETELRDVRNFLDRLILALNRAITNQNISETSIASYKSDANTARTNVNAALAAISAARDLLSSKASAVEVSRKSLEQGVVGDESDIASAQATLKQAQGSLAAARANLEKTIVRAPISGTINSLPLTQGDFVAALSPAATIANNKALEVVAYVTEGDATELSAGSETSVQGPDGATYKGVITRIAPAIDPSTKKLEVRIGLPDTTPLINGAAVTVELKRESKVTTSGPIAIPLSALKIGTDATVVFTVEETGALLAHPVVLGTLLGDRVVITSGLSTDMNIVTDARGLKSGEQVTVK